MSIFSRYVFRQTFGAVMMILLSLTGIVWIATALSQLKLITSEGQDAWIFAKITLLALPNLMVMIAPIALLIAAIHVLNRLNSDSELIVMTASGATVWHFARPLLALAGALSLILLLANLYVLPWSVRTLTDYVVKVRTDLIAQVMQPGEFSSPESGLVFHIRDRLPNGELLGLLMQDTRDPAFSLSYLAERGELIEQDSKAYLLMHTGHIVRRNLAKQDTQIIRFESYLVDLSGFGQATEETWLKPRARYMSELLTPDLGNARDVAKLGSFRSELHERLSNPLYPVVFVMLALANLGIAQTNRQGRVRSVMNAFLGAVFARLLGLAATNLVTLEAAAVPLVYIVPLGAIAIAVVTAQRRAKPRHRSRITRLVDDFIERLFERRSRDTTSGTAVPAAGSASAGTA